MTEKHLNVLKINEHSHLSDSIINKMSDGMIFIDMNHNVIFLNPAAERLTGFSNNEAVGKSVLKVFNIVSSNNGQELTSVLINNTAQKGMYEIPETSILISKTGLIGKHALKIKFTELSWYKQQTAGKCESKLVEVSCMTIMDNIDNLEGMMILFKDVTERSKNQENLEILAKVVEQSPLMIMITDVNGTIEYVNKEFTRITGYELIEIAGKNPSILKSGQTSQDAYRYLWAALKSGGEWKGEFCNKKKNGEIYHEYKKIQSIRDKYDHIKHFLAIAEELNKY